MVVFVQPFILAILGLVYLYICSVIVAHVWHRVKYDHERRFYKWHCNFLKNLNHEQKGV